jgi:peptide/nickel transport system permease protein
MLWKLKRHRVAVVAGIILAVMYGSTLISEIIAPYRLHSRHTDFIYAPPQEIRWFHEGKFVGPFTYDLKRTLNMETLKREYSEDTSQPRPMRFLCSGDPYRFWGLFDASFHLVCPGEGGTLFLAGTDRLGRDVLSRVLVATRVAMLVGIIAVAIALTIGLLLGPVSGYYGGVVDSVIMRAADIFFAFPYILFVLLIMSVLGQGFQNVFIAIGVLGWATFARVVRGQILSVKSMEYVEAARAQGATDLRIIFRHVLPNSMAPVYVAVAMAIGGAIATEAALSYLGIGIQPPNSSWGLMISDAVEYLAGGNWWWLLFPSIALVTTVFGFISFGNGLRDATDPKLKE